MEEIRAPANLRKNIFNFFKRDLKKAGFLNIMLYINYNI